MPSSRRIHCHVPERWAGRRLDQVLAALVPEYSRSRLQQWLRAGHIRVNGGAMRPRDRIAGGETITGVLPVETQTPDRPQAIPLTIVHEDTDILVIDKPAGLVIHPAAGNPDGTLVNALLHHAPELAALPRAGVVHRLDKETSGLLVVARSLRAHTSLVQQLQERTLGREYQAVVNGVMVAGATVDAPIGRHPVDRKRMAVVANGKSAVTHYRLVSRFRAHSHLSIRLETGRTHQIRVHMAHIRHPLVGDPVYGGRPRFPPQVSEHCRQQLQGFGRQALHASRLTLIHPGTGETMTWQSQLPSDMGELLAALAEDAENTHD